ncbi:MAG: BrnT family toxin [Anaerolineales bacterium]|nr:BrnT family toxin [Anaerolineales bacterium]
MTYSWDEAKRQSNLKKHRLDFRDAHFVFDGLTLTFEDNRFDYTEQRFITIGFLAGEFVVIAHSEVESVTRIISMRKATKYEETLFFQAFGD